MPGQLTIVESKPLTTAKGLTIVESKPLVRSLDERQGTSARGYKTPKDESWGGKFMEGAAKSTLMPIGPPIEGKEDAISRAKNLPGAAWNTAKNALSGDPETLGGLAAGAPYMLGGGEAVVGEAIRPVVQASKTAIKNAAKAVIPHPGTGTVLVGAAETAAGLGALSHGVSNMNPVSALIGAKATWDGAKRVKTGLEKRRAAITSKLEEAHAQAVPVEIAAPQGAHPLAVPPNPLEAGRPLRPAPGAEPLLAPAPGVDVVAQKRAEAMRPTASPETPVPVTESPSPAAAEQWDPSKQAPDPIKKTEWFQSAYDAMKARRRGAPEIPVAPESGVTPVAVVDAPLAPKPNVLQEVTAEAGPEMVELAPTPRSRGELAKGSGQQTLGFAPKSFEAGARDAKMMDLADAASAAGLTSKDLASMTKQQRQMLADLATNMRVQLVMEEKGIPMDAARAAVKPIKAFSTDTTGLLLKELSRREAMLKK